MGQPVWQRAGAVWRQSTARLCRNVLPVGFYSSNDRVTGRRTLHGLRCYRTPYVDIITWAYLGSAAPETSWYDRCCRTCFGESGEQESLKGGAPVTEALDSDDDFTSEDSEFVDDEGRVHEGLPSEGPYQ